MGVGGGAWPGLALAHEAPAFQHASGTRLPPLGSIAAGDALSSPLTAP